MISYICLSLTSYFTQFDTLYGQPCCSKWDLTSRPGMDPVPPALEVKSLKHWIAREVPHEGFEMVSLIQVRFDMNFQAS